MTEFTTLEEPFSIQVQDFLDDGRKCKGPSQRKHTDSEFIGLVKYFQSCFIELVLFDIHLHVVKVLWAW